MGWPFARSFHLPHPGYTGLVWALTQGQELIEATPLALWFTQFKGEDTCPHHWEGHGHGPGTRWSNNPSPRQLCLAESTVPSRARIEAAEVGGALLKYRT